MLRGSKTLDLPADSTQVVDEVRWEILRGMQGPFQVQMQVTDQAGTVTSDNTFDFVT